MSINPSDHRFFLRAHAAIKNVCNGSSPTNCKDYRKFQEAFEAKCFSVKTTQSYVGVLSYKKNGHILVVFKISKEEDNVVLNEYDILRQLDGAARACPHFVKVHGLCDYLGSVDINPISSLKRPPSSGVAIERRMLLLEHVSNVGCMYDIIENLKKNSEHKLISLIGQTLVALRVAHSLGITHNDIHCENVLIKKCDARTCLRYIFKMREIVVPTFGYVSVIIDFGLGRSAQEEKMPLYGSFNFTHYGYFSDEFAPQTDYIRLLSSLRSSTKERFPLISKWCDRHLKKIKGIDRDIGWDSFHGRSAVESFAEKLQKIYPEVKLLTETIWVENLQVLIERPLQEMHGSVASLAPFFEQWRRFEERISSLSELNYLFRSFVFAVKLWKSDYLRQNSLSVERIKRSFLEKYEAAIKFHCPEVNYDEMICSLILGSSYLEGYYYNHIQMLKNKKPRRSGVLAAPDCDEEIWKSFIEMFGKNLSPPKDADYKNCYFLKL